MNSFVQIIDRLNTSLGKLFGWAIVFLTLVISYEVFSRYLLGRPTSWAFDASYMLYGLLFMMAGPYTLARNGHVRGDFLYRTWRPRRQAATDLVLYFLFFFPGICALIYAGSSYFWLSFQLNETSSFSPFGLILWPFKAVIPIVGVMMALQGLAEVIRCMTCLKTGEWPPRLHDVQETEALAIEGMSGQQDEVDEATR
ncbi:TRAP-type mannitol/chloroaromatic compound transport system permease small subunit [Rhodoligotrophos appendicifer]|uniref:TRAP transporter small permease subunit n=1 Tax=Rhodoligotrophos appendicifer TaxID=987056 RepID=UPI0011870D24|nr:TRAP transporter small permease subunit [Rhodoligotrophos appendicifer]